MYLKKCIHLSELADIQYLWHLKFMGRDIPIGIDFPTKNARQALSPPRAF
jgi:hypothetical protein